MTDVLEQQHEETAPIESAAQLPTDAPVGTAPASADDELTALLNEFDAATTKAETEPTGALGVDNNGADNIDQQLQDMLGPSECETELTGQINDLRTQLHRESEIRAYHDYADDLQKHVQEANPHVPDGWTKLMMDSFAHNPEIALAWDTRNIDPKAAAVDLAHVQHALNQLKGNPGADPKQVQELNRLAYQLDICVRSPAILRQCRNQILAEAKKLKPPIDEQVTADVAGLTQYIRDGQAAHVPDPPTNWGRLSGKEFREKVIRDHGFDPGGF
jgi:hypothetical protein